MTSALTAPTHSQTRRDVAYDVRALELAIDNRDVKLQITGSGSNLSIMPAVSRQSGRYLQSRNLIRDKDNTFYLSRTNYASGDSRLIAAHRLAVDNYNYTSLDLGRTGPTRATFCERNENLIKNPNAGVLTTMFETSQVCYYASPNVCSHMRTQYAKHSFELDKCQDLIKDLKKILPLEVENYNSTLSREMTKIHEFAKANNVGGGIGTDRFAEFKNFPNYESNILGATAILDQVKKTLRLCDRYFPSASSAAAPPAASPRRGRSTEVR